MKIGSPLFSNFQFSIFNFSFHRHIERLRENFDSLENRKIILFGGKGGVGKTTLASLAALHFSARRDVTLFSTDPASNLQDLFPRKGASRLGIESVDANALYQAFLRENLDAFLELGDRGTYLDREELRRFFELSLPGADELMAWLRIGDLAESRQDMLIVDTAPTGHTLRMLGSSGHFRQLETALEAMQSKHAELVAQLTRRTARDAMDQFLERFSARLERNRALITDSAFVPVFLAEPIVVDQTLRLVDELRSLGVPAPFAVLNQAVHGCDCPECSDRRKEEERAAARLELPAVTAPRACVQIDSADRLNAYLAGQDVRAAIRLASGITRRALVLPGKPKLVFFAGKGGVGKTSLATSLALQTAAASPDARFTLISVDPAHSLREVFAAEAPPLNLSVETIDTRAKWKSMRDSLREEISRAVDALTPRGVSLVHDQQIIQQLLEIAPPGADELFAIDRLSDLAEDADQARIFVDTAPTGHFLRLIELPQTAGEWVREFMRLLLKYRDFISPGSLGEQLVRASRALKNFDELLRSSECATVVVTRAERIVIRETTRLAAELERRGVHVAVVVANALTPENDCSCDGSRRSDELTILEELGREFIPVERRSPPPAALDDLRTLLPLRQT